MVSSGRFCEWESAPGAQNPVRRGGVDFRPPKGGYSASPGRLRLFPRLRCKSGLCYTADANSPFEAYIYVR